MNRSGEITCDELGVFYLVSFSILVSVHDGVFHQLHAEDLFAPLGQTQSDGSSSATDVQQDRIGGKTLRRKLKGSGFLFSQFDWFYFCTCDVSRGGIENFCSRAVDLKECLRGNVETEVFKQSLRDVGSPGNELNWRIFLT